MGQKRTWSFHHVPFSMLWESMPLDYKNNWNSVVFSQLLNSFSGAIFDKENINNRFVFTWKAKHMPVSIRNITRKLKKNQYPKVAAQAWKVNPVFSWVSNANKGTNETSCVRSYLAKFGNTSTVLNFFFREKFSLEKLHKKHRGGVKKSKASATALGLAMKRVKTQFCWVSKRWSRKVSKKQRSGLSTVVRRVVKVFRCKLRAKTVTQLRRQRISRRGKRRLRTRKQVTWRVGSGGSSFKSTKTQLLSNRTVTRSWGITGVHHNLHKLL